MGNIISFKEIFNNSIFRIPDYQRGYSWTQKELDDLWADLTNTHLHKNSYHFTGILTLNTFNSSDLKSIKEEGFNIVDRKSTRLNSSHVRISYAVFCLKKKNNKL